VRHDRRRRGARPPRVKRPQTQPDLSRIAGLSAVSALFSTAPERVERLFFAPERRAEMEAFCARLARTRKPFRQVNADELARISGTAMHGGVVALARPRPILPLDAVQARLWAPTVPLLLILDGIGNPQNFGAIVRTAAFFGIDRLVISDHPVQAGPSDAAHRVAEGGLEFVQLYRAAKLAQAVKHLKPAYRVVGTALGGRSRPLAELPRDKPIALILGNEEAGLDPAMQAACDDVVTIPGAGWIQSLNVGATAAILMHELLRK
jgi:TrmH RNA methyltransferase